MGRAAFCLSMALFAVLGASNAGPARTQDFVGPVDRLLDLPDPDSKSATEVSRARPQRCVPIPEEPRAGNTSAASPPAAPDLRLVLTFLPVRPFGRAGLDALQLEREPEPKDPICVARIDRVELRETSVEVAVAVEPWDAHETQVWGALIVAALGVIASFVAFGIA
ncbi:MAG: hypothetical protein HZA53_05435 [Planctomycetes bacterium]|nr:hypothetical protein [Planctomycetota bacterium]